MIIRAVKMPDGLVWPGVPGSDCHHDIVMSLVRSGLASDEDVLEAVYGFVDDAGRFYAKEEERKD